jgi:flavodoxin
MGGKDVKALVVYDSVYGNTESVARAVAAAMDTAAVRMADARPADVAGADLLVVGSPTVGGRPTAATSRYLDGIPASALTDLRVASFDTRMEVFVAKLFGYAGVRIADTLVRKGARAVTPPEGFIVKGREGPLKAGELERAAAWARTVSGGQGTGGR